MAHPSPLRVFFRRGANQSYKVVSEILASNDVTPLQKKGLVDSMAFNMIKFQHKKMDRPRRSKFRLDADRALVWPTAHPKIEIVDDRGLGAKRRIVVIIMCFRAAVFKPSAMQAETHPVYIREGHNNHCQCEACFVAKRCVAIENSLFLQIILRRLLHRVAFLILHMLCPCASI